MALLALPAAASASNSPRKEKKRKRKDKASAKDKDKDKDKNKEYDSDAELEVSAEDLIAADGEGGGQRAQGEGDDEDEEETQETQTTGQVALDVKQRAKRKREETLLLRGVLDEEQGRRFDAFHSTVMPKSVVKKLNRDVYDQPINNNLTAVLAGLMKIFVADVTEKALELQQHTEHPDGPLQPYHLQLARMQLQQQGLMAAPTGGSAAQSSTGLRPRKRMFRR